MKPICNSLKYKLDRVLKGRLLPWLYRVSGKRYVWLDPAKGNVTTEVRVYGQDQ